MAFEFSKKLFSRTPSAQVEQGEQGADVIKKLESYHQDALHNIKVTHKDGLAFSDANNAEFGVIRLELAEKVGQDIAEAAIKEYMKVESPSRRDELNNLLERQPQLRTKLFESLAKAMSPVNTDAMAALEEVKAFIKVANARHFSDQDINQLCEEIIASEEFELFIRERVMAAPANPAVIEQPTIIPEAVAELPEQEAEEVSKLPFELRPPSTPPHKVIREASDISGLTPEVAALHKKTADSGKSTNAV
jgi:hypothetical protein